MTRHHNTRQRLHLNRLNTSTFRQRPALLSHNNRNVHRKHQIENYTKTRPNVISHSNHQPGYTISLDTHRPQTRIRNRTSTSNHRLRIMLRRITLRTRSPRSTIRHLNKHHTTRLNIHIRRRSTFTRRHNTHTRLNLTNQRNNSSLSNQNNPRMTNLNIRKHTNQTTNTLRRHSRQLTNIQRRPLINMLRQTSNQMLTITLTPPNTRRHHRINRIKIRIRHRSLSADPDSCTHAATLDQRTA